MANGSWRQEQTPHHQGGANLNFLAPHPVATFRDGDALLILDLHRDFLPNWALPVPWGGRLSPQIAACVQRFFINRQPVIMVRDAHLPAVNRLLDSPGVQWFFADKNAASALDQFSLTESLRLQGVRRIFLCGLALEHDWLWTSRDALAQGFELVLITDLIVALDAQPGATPRALAVADREGAQQVGSEEFLHAVGSHHNPISAASAHALA